MLRNCEQTGRFQSHAIRPVCSLVGNESFLVQSTFVWVVELCYTKKAQTVAWFKNLYSLHSGKVVATRQGHLKVETYDIGNPCRINGSSFRTTNTDGQTPTYDLRFPPKPQSGAYHTKGIDSEPGPPVGIPKKKI